LHHRIDHAAGQGQQDERGGRVRASSRAAGTGSASALSPLTMGRTSLRPCRWYQTIAATCRITRAITSSLPSVVW
jgi:hypothetical protein